MFSFNLTIVVFAFFQISATMQKFEGMFEDLDVNTQVECAVNSIIFYLLLWNNFNLQRFHMWSGESSYSLQLNC